MNARKMIIILVLALAMMSVSACAGENTLNQVNNDSGANAGNAGEMDTANDANAAAENNNSKDEDAGGAGEGLVTIAQADLLVAQIEEPALYIFSDPDAFKEIAEWFSPEQRDAVAGIDYNSYYLAAAFYGVASTSGHSITVQEVYVEGDVVKVIAAREGVPEGSMASDVISYPYHLVTIPKDGLDVPEGALWELIDTEGVLLATFTP